MKLITRLLLTVVLLCGALWATDGTLTVLVFKDGRPVTAAQVLVDGAEALRTDADGEAYLKISEGAHEISVVVKEADQTLGVARKNVTVAADKNTQVIVTVEQEGSLVDVESSKAALNGAETAPAADTAELPKGALLAQIVSSEDGKPVSGARIFVKGSSVDAKSDAQGNFNLELPAGEHTISVIHTDFSSQTLHVTIVANETQTHHYELSPASLEMAEFVVLAPHIQGSVAAVMSEEKQSSAITSILGSEEMGKKGDSNAAGALKRVTGVTLVDGKSVYVRGLGDRYSNVELNSMPLPSPDPTKRMVPLDIFPASVIDSIVVQKSATADIPSNFGGGYINVRTKDNTDEDFFQINLALKANSNTFKSSNTYEGSETDYLGYDDGYRDIDPALLQATEVTEGERVKGITTSYYTQEEISQMTQNYINRLYNVTEEDLPLGYGWGFSGAKKFQLTDMHSISVSGGYEYKQEHTHRVEESYSYDMDENGVLNTTATKSGLKYKTVSSFEHGAIFNLGYRYGDRFSLKYTKLFTHNADKSTRIADGNFGSNEADQLIFYFLDWEERELQTDQLNSEFNYELMGQKARLSLGGQLATASLEQPNNYEYLYIKQGDTYILNNETTNHIARNLESEDDLTSYYIKNRQNIPIFSDEDYIELGYSASSKERESRQRKYYLRDSADGLSLSQDIDSIYAEYVLADIPYEERLFLVTQLFKAADYFDAEVDESAFYLNTFVNPTGKIEVMLGARYVDFKQTVYQYQEDRDNPDMTLRRLIARIPESLTVKDVYPSFSLKYKADDANHVDFAVSQTYIVPDLREFTSGEYYHPYDVATVVGNPELENTDILSVDLKYSHYFSSTEALKAGIFYKYLDKPIEDVMLPSSSLPIYSFDNADSAVLYGFEIDGRKNLGFIAESMEPFYISGNFSYTDSEVTLRPEQLDTFSTDNRPLQGLSEIVYNATLGYDGDGRSLALSYNYMGERIRKVGLIDAGDRYPDHYEIPPELLDFVWIEKFRNGVSTKVKLQNLLDSETVWEQGGLVTNRYKTGVKYEFALSYKY